MGVECDTMSLKLLTGQSKLVDALTGMYMKSLPFVGNTGRGEYIVHGAPQVCAPLRLSS